MLFLLSSMQRTICLSVSLQCGIFNAVCLNLDFIAVKRYYDQGNSHKGHLIGGSVQIQRFSLISRLKKWQCPSRHGAGGDESSTSLSEGSQKTLLPWVELKHRISKSTPTVTYFLKCHIYSRNAILPNTATCHRPSIFTPFKTTVKAFTTLVIFIGLLFSVLLCIMNRLYHIVYIYKVSLQHEFFHVIEVDYEGQRIYYIAYLHKVSLQYIFFYAFEDYNGI